MLENVYPSGEAEDAGSKELVESRLAGAFSGCTGRTEFRLLNGQLWRQRSLDCFYRYRYMPRVAILSTPAGQLMRVEGVPRTIPVVRVG